MTSEGEPMGVLDHAPALDLVALALDGPLPGPYADQLADHLAGCVSCRTAAEAMGRDATALRSIARADAPARLREAVMTSALRSAGRGGQQWIQSFRRWAWLGVAGVVFALVAGGLVGTTGLSSPQAEAPRPAPLLAAWTRTAPGLGSGQAAGGTVSGIARHGDAFAAVGSGAAGGAAWFSDDGRTWAIAPDTAMFQDAHLAGISSTRVGFVAVGFAVGPDGTRIAAAWTSRDARNWARSADGSGLGGGAMNAVAASAERLVAVGIGSYPFGARAWTSHDGTSWEAVPVDETFAGAVMTSVTATRTGFVSVGHDAAGARAWLSRDGRHWAVAAPGAAASNTPAFEGGRMTSVAVGGPGLIAVGYASSLAKPLTAAMWTSPDGGAWRRVAGDESLRGIQLHGVVALSRGFVALGHDHAGAVALTSLDGVAWRPIPRGDGFARAVMTGATAAGDALVAVGGDSQGPAIWRLEAVANLISR